MVPSRSWVVKPEATGWADGETMDTEWRHPNTRPNPWPPWPKNTSFWAERGWLMVLLVAVQRTLRTSKKIFAVTLQQVA